MGEWILPEEALHYFFYTFWLLHLISPLINYRRYSKKKTPPKTAEGEYVTVSRTSDSGTSTAANAYTATDVNKNIDRKPKPKDKEDKAQSQQIHAYAEVNQLPEGPRKPNLPTQSSDLTYDYAEVSKGTSTARMPPGDQCASNRTDKSLDVNYDLPSFGNTSSKPVNSSDLPYDYADVSEGLFQTRMPPGVKSKATNDKPQDVSYDHLNRGNKSPDPANSPEPQYDYVDASKVVPHARMPPGYPSPSVKDLENQSLSPNYDQPSLSNKSSTPKVVTPYAYADVTKEVPNERQKSLHLYAYADVNDFKKVESPRHEKSSEEEGWSENTLYGRSGARQDDPKPDSGKDGEGWKKNSIYESGAARV